MDVKQEKEECSISNDTNSALHEKLILFLKKSNDTNPAKSTQKNTTKTAQNKRRSIPTKASKEKNKSHQHEDDAILAERTTKRGWPQKQISTNNQNIQQDDARLLSTKYIQNQHTPTYKISTDKYNLLSFSKMMPDKIQTKSAPTNTTFCHSAR